MARQILNIPDTSMPASLFKNQLKKFLTDKQTLGDDIAKDDFAKAFDSVNHDLILLKLSLLKLILRIESRL